MSAHQTLLTIQYITIFALFIESCIVFRFLKNRVHAYLLFFCASALINSLGYLLEMYARTKDSYLTALKLSYFGRCWTGYALFMFAAEFCAIRIPALIRYILVAVHVGIYASVLTAEYHGLYYSHLEYVSGKMYHGNGVLHHLLMGIQICYIILGVIWLFRLYYRSKSKKRRKRTLMVLLAVFTMSFFFIIQVVGTLGVTKYYDLTMFGILGCTIFMMIAIFRFDLLGISEIAKEYIVDRISEGIIAVDNEGVIQYYNEPAKKLYPEIADPSAPLPAAITDAISEDKNITIEERIYSPEENNLIYQGENAGKIYALVDDTEHFRYMEELKKQREIADNANEAKSRFLASMSHEIRTPINAVLGMDEMILRESTEKPIRSYAADIMSAGRTLLSLINDILDLSKVEEGKMEIIPVQYELASLINDLSNMIRDRAAKKGLEFKISVCEQTPNVLFGDEIRIRQCVLNLLTNAVKYTEAGSVSLEVGFEKKDEKHILLSFSVIDTGIGMKQEDLEKLFTPYQRIEEERNRSIEGTGLGMSIVSQLLELMGSTLDVKSEYGKGSSFSFTLEQEVLSSDEIGDFSIRYQNQAGDEPSYQELFCAPDARILVVDDTEVNLTVIENLLKKTGIKIDSVMSGKDAIRLASDEAYDMVFVDHMMPDMDGIETLKHLRESGKNTETPAVALTANAVSGARKMYLDAGFTDYLAKPVDGMHLEKMLMTYLPAEKIKDPGTAGELPDAASSENMQPVMIPEWLYGIPEINVKEGIKNSGSEEGYLSILSIFHQVAPANATEIETLWKNGDQKNYTVKVHALKSSARIIGAAELSALAKDLEAAGKGDDTAFIDANTEKLLRMYRELDQKFTPLDEEDSSLPEITPESMKDAYRTIDEIAGAMDYEMMDRVLTDVKGYRLPPKDKGYIAEMERLMTELDWEKIGETARKALEEK